MNIILGIIFITVFGILFVYFHKLVYWIVKYILSKIYDKFLSKKIAITVKQINWIAIGLIVMCYACPIYDAIYPSDDFYEDDFKETFQIEFPDSGKIISKSATFPDIHGDYTSMALFSVNKNDMNLIIKRMDSNKYFVRFSSHTELDPKLRLGLSEKQEVNFDVNYKLQGDTDSNYSLSHIYYLSIDTKHCLVNFERSSW